MSYPLERLRPIGPRERPPPRTFNTRRGDGNETININLGQSGAQASPFSPGGNMMPRRIMEDRMSQEHVNDSLNIDTGKTTHWIVLLVIFLVIVGVIGVVLYMTGAFKSSQTIYTDSATCCTTCTECSKNLEGVGSCGTCNNCKSCDKSGL